MNREERVIDPHAKEATCDVLTDASVTLGLKHKMDMAGFKIKFSFSNVPVAVTDKQIERSVADELDNVYKKRETLRLLDENDKLFIFDTEEIAFIKVDKIEVFRGGNDASI